MHKKSITFISLILYLCSSFASDSPNDGRMISNQPSNISNITKITDAKNSPSNTTNTTETNSPPINNSSSNKKESIPIVVDAIDRLNYSSPISGFIEHVFFKEGAVFKKDDILVQYNCTTMRSEKEKAAAAVTFLTEKAHNMERLFNLGGASNNDQAESKSQLKSAEEELNIKSYVVSHCDIKAPFDGQVVKVFASPFEYIEQGRPLIEVVNLSHLEIKLILPSQWLSTLKEGAQFSVQLNETKQSYSAEITRIVYSIDAVSNTFVAFARFINEPAEIKPGMSGNAEFEVRQ